MIPTITAFATSPDRGRGLARDMRVRWALEEAGQPYQVRLLSFEEMKQPAHLALQPFGQIPTYEEGELVLFETGAILLHIAQRSEALWPAEAARQKRATSWLFAALNTLEPPIVELGMASLFEADKPWAGERRPMLEERVRARLEPLSKALGGKDWLDEAFTVADLMMVSVLIRSRSSGLLGEFPTLDEYVSRGEARPAYQRAFAAQLAVFEGSQPDG